MSTVKTKVNWNGSLLRISWPRDWEMITKVWNRILFYIFIPITWILIIGSSTEEKDVMGL